LPDRARRHKKRKNPTNVERTLPVTASKAQIALFMPWAIGEDGSPRQTEQAWAEADDKATSKIATGRARLLPSRRLFADLRRLAGRLALPPQLFIIGS